MRRISVGRFPDVEAAREHYLNVLDEQVASPPAGVTAVREAKWQEVLQGGGPLLEAEATAMGETLEQTIERVTLARTTAMEKQAAAEADRVQKKAAIRAATTACDMHLIVHGDTVVDADEGDVIAPVRFRYHGTQDGPPLQ